AVSITCPVGAHRHICGWRAYQRDLTTIRQVLVRAFGAPLVNSYRQARHCDREIAAGIGRLCRIFVTGSWAVEPQAEADGDLVRRCPGRAALPSNVSDQIGG